MDLFDLVAKITLDSSEYEQGLDDAKGKASGWAGAFGKVAKVGGIAVGAVTTTVAGMSAALVKGTSDVASYGDNIDKMSQKMGLSAEAYQEWDAIMQHSGTSIDSMQRGMTTLSSAVENGSDAFATLGISLEDAAAMSQEELFATTITALQNMESGTERTVLAQQLLGGSAKELGALLNTSAEDTEAMRQRVHELGGVMSNDAVKAAAAYQDSLQDMQTAFSGLSRGLVTEFMPGITTVMDGLTEIFAGDSEAGLALVSTGIDDLMSQITEKLPEFVEVGLGIIESLANAIIENIPALAGSAIEIIGAIASNIIQNLPKLIESGLSILITLAKSIGDNLSTIIPAIVDVVMQIIETLTSPESITSLINGAITLILGLVDGFIRAIPRIIQAIPTIITNVVRAIISSIPQIKNAGVQLLVSLVANLPTIIIEIVKAIPEIINGIVSALADGWEMMKEAGQNLLIGLWNGIVGAADWLWQQISGWLDSLWDGMLGFFGIHSPSTEMAWVGEMLVDGLSNSIGKNGEEAVDAAEQMSDDIMSAMDKLSDGEFGADVNIRRNVADSFDGMESSLSRTANTALSGDPLFSENGIINIVVQSVLDGKVIGETAYRYQRNMARVMG